MADASEVDRPLRNALLEVSVLDSKSLIHEVPADRTMVHIRAKDAWSRIGSNRNTFNNDVNALAVNSAGKIFAGGIFTKADGNTVSSVAQFDGTNWSAMGTGITGGSAQVNAVVADKSGNVYVGGNFFTAGGNSAVMIAKWNGTAWSALGTGMNGPVEALAFDSSGNLYAGGQFTTAGGNTANRIAKWDGTSWSTLGTGFNFTVLALAFDSSGNLFAGGDFSSAGGNSANKIAKWNGSSWSALGSGMNSKVFELALDSSDNLFAGGQFTTAGGTTVNRIAKWNGTAWSALGSGVNTTVEALTIDPADNVYAGGQITTAGGVSVNRVAKWNGSSWSALESDMSGQVKTLVDKSGVLYAAGSFSFTTGGTEINFAAQIDIVSPPTAGNDSITTSEDTAVTIEVLSNDNDPDNQTLTVVLNSIPSLGAATVNSDGTITYTPSSGVSGADTFEYTVTDTDGGSATATVFVTITAVNDAPNAVADSATTAEDESVVIDLAGNDSDPEGDAISVTAVDDPPNGSAVLADGSITYTPDPDFFGTDTFSYTVSDGSLSAEGTVTVEVTPVNDAPAAGDDAASVDAGSTITINVLLNDSDPDGDALTVGSLGSASLGSATNNNDGTITYSADPSLGGVDTFTYTVTDGDGATATALVVVTVLGPSADGDGISEEVERDAPNNGDGNLDGIPDVDQPNVGSLPIASGVNEGSYVTVATTANLRLTDVSSSENPSPEDFPDGADETIGFLSYTVDGLAPGGTSVVTITLPAGVSPNAYLKYGPTPDNPTPHWYEFGYDGQTGAFIIGSSVTLILVDGLRGDDDLTVNGAIDDPGAPVTTSNAAPSAEDDSVQLLEDGSIEHDLLANDSDADGDILLMSLASDPQHGAVTLIGGGAMRYEPTEDFFGTDLFTYRVSDPSGASATGTVTIVVEPVEDLPVARDDEASTVEDAPVTIDVFGNDSDADGDTVYLAAQGSPGHGRSIYNADRTITYHPDANYHGTDTWQYSITDGTGHSGTIARATVTVTVDAVNDAPEFATSRPITVPFDAFVLAENPYQITFAPAEDVDGDTVVHWWELATDSVFQDIVMSVQADSSGSLSVPSADLIAALDPVGLREGQQVVAYQRLRADDGMGGVTVSTPQEAVFARSVSVGVTDESGIPEDYFLDANYPNPFNPRTVIRFGMPEAEHVTLAVFDILGRQVALPLAERKPAGIHEVEFDASGLPSGVYLYQLITSDRLITRSMQVLK